VRCDEPSGCLDQPGVGVLVLKRCMKAA
jgi:hypothetical protein